MTFSNRTLWILVLIWALWFFYLLYLYFFVYFVSTLKIESNVDNYKVSLYAKSVAQTFERNCETSSCILTDISPFDYTLTVEKDWYETLSQGVDLKWWIEKTVSITMKKTISLVPAEQRVPLTENKVEALKIKSRAYITYDMYEKWLFYFEKVAGKLDLYRILEKQENMVGTFNEYTPQEVSLIDVVWDTSTILIHLWNENYIYNSDINILTKINLNIPILYAKKSLDGWDVHIVTEKGTFLYDINTSNIRYATTFSDYVEIWDKQIIWYLWIDDTNRRTNFWYTSDWGLQENLLLGYNQDTFEKEVLYKLPFAIQKIYIWESAKLYIENVSWELFEVAWIDIIYE